MDGCMANVREEGWKEIKIGTVFEVSANRVKRMPNGSEVAEGVHGHTQSYVLHLGGPEGFGFKLATEAQARQWSKSRQSAVVGDGAAWIWNLAATDYPSAAHIVDWWHAKQHVHAAAAMLYPDAAESAAAWAERQSDRLFLGQAAALGSDLRHQAAQTSNSQLLTEAGFFEANHERMQYQDFRAAGLPIGSGVVESGAKQTKQRVSAAGMRWSRTGLENMLPLRAAVMSGTFDSLWARICPF